MTTEEKNKLNEKKQIDFLRKQEQLRLQRETNKSSFQSFPSKPKNFRPQGRGR